jgi:hypothetical protein
MIRLGVAKQLALTRPLLRTLQAGMSFALFLGVALD